MFHFGLILTSLNRMVRVRIHVVVLILTCDGLGQVFKTWPTDNFDWSECFRGVLKWRYINLYLNACVKDLAVIFLEHELKLFVIQGGELFFHGSHCILAIFLGFSLLEHNHIPSRSFLWSRLELYKFKINYDYGLLFHFWMMMLV